MIELLIGQTLAFIGIVTKNDEVALNAYCHLVMKECIALQEMCLGYDSNDKEINATDRDKRLQAQQLQNALYGLDRLMNECFLRVFYTTFADLQPLISERTIPPAKQFTEQFDDILDRLIQIGLFAMAYTSNPKAKSHLQSCLATFEALSVSLVSSMASKQFERDADYLANHWNDTVNRFRCSVHEIINTQAFSLVLVDVAYETLSELTQTNFDRSALKAILSRCTVLAEHIQVNANELRLSEETKLKLYVDDFKLMIKECRACIKCKPDVDDKRIRKRFNILLSLITNISKASGQVTASDDADVDQENKPFTFGDVTAPTDNMALRTVNEPDGSQVAANESMAVVVDLNEFIAQNQTVQKELTRRSEIFYETRRSVKSAPKFLVVSNTVKTPLKKDVNNAKRLSKSEYTRIAENRAESQSGEC